MLIKIKNGLNIPILGAVKSSIEKEIYTDHLAILSDDYAGMKPKFDIKIGDYVKKGQLLFTHKKNDLIRFTSPASGKIIEINRGERRSFQSIVIEKDKNNDSNEVAYTCYQEQNVESLSKENIINLLVETGEWCLIRKRPFSTIPNPSLKNSPNAIFVTAIDTNPLAVEPLTIIKKETDSFIIGLKILATLSNDNVKLCTKNEDLFPGENTRGVKRFKFLGPHPAGNVGTHINFLSPVNLDNEVWHLGHQEVIAIGKLFSTGKIYNKKWIALTGPSIKEPKLVKTNIGASIKNIVEEDLKPVINYKHRIVSGSILNGREVIGPYAYLGRYHNQITVLPDDRTRNFLGWMSLGFNKFSLKNVFLSKLLPPKTYQINTSTNGDKRALVPIGSYEKIFPLKTEPTYLLRSLLCYDTDSAQDLGCLDLDEEDLALATYVCPSKIDYGVLLRENLNIIERDG